MPEVRSEAHLALGEAIRSLRLERSLSQEGLAERAQLDRTYVGGVERGERNVAVANLLRIASALGVAASELLRLSEERRPTAFPESSG